MKLFLSVFHLSDKNSGVKIENLELNPVQLPDSAGLASLRADE
ncbi:hypothetical protein COO91_03850 [Nostoc flagelliforme CCNUN1]|uniref:Uncharacterized protein n=1 Tax=Nostoc flagelliforme CCNUN1 TaxID=2038116 RepID=A0A2K8SR72_9NOSO|nr:hypothetical protein COO91_03850 [Nostoc flagelliforme CCNUN1]